MSIDLRTNFLIRSKWMEVPPQRECGRRRIDTRPLPPCGFVAMVMDLAMMTAAERDCKFIADLATERPALCKAQVMWIRRAATANQASLLGNVSDVLAIPYSAGLRYH